MTDFWRNFSQQFYLLSESLLEICWEEIAEEILFVFLFDVLPGARILSFFYLLNFTKKLQRIYHLHLLFRLETVETQKKYNIDITGCSKSKYF